MVSRAAVQAKQARHAASLARSTHGFVATPPELAEVMCGWPYAMVATGNRPRVLEPSAGDGALVAAILDADPDATVVAVEPDAGRAATLGRFGTGRVQVAAGTFEDYAVDTADRYDAVVMNPPWSLPGQQGVWVGHVLAAWDLLRPGGRLVAVVPQVDQRGAAGKRLAELVAAHGGFDPVDRDDAAARAGFPAARLLWLARPTLAADGRGPGPDWLLRPAPGNPVTVTRLDVGPAGLAQPVQQYEDRWDGYRWRTARYVGTCCTCHRLLWTHDDGHVGAACWEANSCLEADEYGLSGPTVGLCMECASHRDRYDRALELARQRWSDTPPPARPAPLPDLADLADLPTGQLALPLTD